MIKKRREDIFKEAILTSFVNFIIDFFKVIFGWLLGRLFLTIEVDNHSTIYHAIDSWIEDQSYMKKVKNIRYISLRRGDFISSPGMGTQILWIKKRPVLFTRVANEEGGQWDKAFERMTLRIPFMTKEEADKWIIEIIEANEIKAEKFLSVYQYKNGYWQKTSKLPERPMNTISLKKGMSEKLISDLKSFLDSREKYNQIGIPWRRGYLLYGSPGTGKTSTTLAIANECDLSVAFLSLTASGTNDESLIDAVNLMPKNSILLLEDIDAASNAVKSRENNEDEGENIEDLKSPKKKSNNNNNSSDSKSDVTLSGLLNALDGVVSPEGLVVFMTTNHPEKLDKALVREGRVDYKVEFELADEQQAFEIVKRIRKDREDLQDKVKEIISSNGPISHAKIQSACLTCDTIEEFEEFLTKKATETDKENEE